MVWYIIGFTNSGKQESKSFQFISSLRKNKLFHQRKKSQKSKISFRYFLTTKSLRLNKVFNSQQKMINFTHCQSSTQQIIWPLKTWWKKLTVSDLFRKIVITQYQIKMISFFQDLLMTRMKQKKYPWRKRNFILPKEWES